MNDPEADRFASLDVGVSESGQVGGVNVVLTWDHNGFGINIPVEERTRLCKEYGLADRGVRRNVEMTILAAAGELGLSRDMDEFLIAYDGQDGGLSDSQLRQMKQASAAMKTKFSKIFSKANELLAATGLDITPPGKSDILR